MIQMQTRLHIADNSGGVRAMCIKVLGGSKRRYANIGDVIKVSIKEASPRSKVKKGDVIYVFSDGFPDQFGGPKGKKYNSKQFKSFLLSISQLPLDEQHKLIEKEFNDWRGDLEQVDDLCIVGVRV